MGCISKLNKAILANCQNGAAGIEEMILINSSDVSTVAVSAGVVTLTLAGAGVLVEGLKKAINATEGLKANDNAPTALTQSVVFTVYNKDVNSAVIVNTILNGRFIALAKMKEMGVYRAYGVTYGMESNEVSEDANANGGYTTIKLATPENVLGEMRLTLTKAHYDSIRTAAVKA